MYIYVDVVWLYCKCLQWVGGCGGSLHIYSILFIWYVYIYRYLGIYVYVWGEGFMLRAYVLGIYSWLLVWWLLLLLVFKYNLYKYAKLVTCGCGVAYWGRGEGRFCLVSDTIKEWTTDGPWGGGSGGVGRSMGVDCHGSEKRKSILLRQTRLSIYIYDICIFIGMGLWMWLTGGGTLKATETTTKGSVSWQMRCVCLCVIVWVTLNDARRAFLGPNIILV